MIIDKINKGGLLKLEYGVQRVGKVESGNAIKANTFVSGSLNAIVPYNGVLYGIALESKGSGQPIKVVTPN